jgi:hypothetical protein
LDWNIRKRGCGFSAKIDPTQLGQRGGLNCSRNALSGRFIKMKTVQADDEIVGLPGIGSDIFFLSS